MPSQADRTPKGARRITTLALLLATALALGALERAIPFQPPVPGVRLGLPNVAILFALYCFPLADCLTLTLMKCLLTSLIAGSLPSFWYSVCGSLLSLAGMALLLRLLREKVSPVGVSVAGAVLHNTGQLLAASLLMGTAVVMAVFPFLLLSAVVTGFLTGTAVRYLLRVPVIAARGSPDRTA